MTKIRFYIGANNDTKKLDKKTIEKVLNKHYEGYSAFEIVGYWKGEREKTLLVELISEKSEVLHAKVAKELCKACNQESVLIEVTEVNATFITN